MPATNFLEYAQNIETVLNHSVVSGEATLTNVQIDQRSSFWDFISGLISFPDESTLHFREFIDLYFPLNEM